MKKHKEDSGCNGIRNKTAFVPLSEFDEMALLSGEQPPLVLFTRQTFLKKVLNFGAF